MAHDNAMIDSIIMQEFQTEIQQSDQSFDQEGLIKEYDQILGELNSYLKESLQDESQWNDEQQNEILMMSDQIDQRATEMQVAYLTQDGENLAVCALCREGYVYKC